MEQEAKAEEQGGGAIVLPYLAIDPGRQPDIGDLRFIRVGNKPWAEAPRGIEILALRDVELGMSHPIADGAFVAERDRRDVIERVALRDMPAGLADHEHQFAFIVQLGGCLRPYERCFVTDKRTRRAEEHARIFWRVRAVFIFGVAIGVIDTDADDFFRRRNRRPPCNGLERMIRRKSRGVLDKSGQCVSGDDLSQGRKLLAPACGEVDHAAIGHGAVSGGAIDGEGGNAGRDHGCSGEDCAQPLPGVMPLALRTATASGDIRKSIKALAASFCLVSTASAAGNTNSCCNPGGNGPTMSTPGAARTLFTKTASSAWPLTTAGMIPVGCACAMVLAFIASSMPNRSNSLRI